jgi:hypothetical protein
MTAIFALIACAIGCFLYATAKEKSSYAQRVFSAYVINVIVITVIIASGERAFLLMLLPSFYAIAFLRYAIAFLRFELHKAVDDPALAKDHLIIEKFTKTLFFFASGCGALSLFTAK